MLTSVKKIKKNKYPKEIIKKLPFLLKKESVKIILVTCHRRENFDTGISNICKALLEIAKNNSMIKIVFSVHSNPNIRKPVKKILKDVKNIYLMKPIKYLNFVHINERIL